MGICNLFDRELAGVSPGQLLVGQNWVVGNTGRSVKRSSCHLQFGRRGFWHSTPNAGPGALQLVPGGENRPWCVATSKSSEQGVVGRRQPRFMFRPAFPPVLPFQLPNPTSVCVRAVPDCFWVCGRRPPNLWGHFHVLPTSKSPHWAVDSRRTLNLRGEHKKHLPPRGAGVGGVDRLRSTNGPHGCRALSKVSRLRTHQPTARWSSRLDEGFQTCAHGQN